MDTLRVQEGIIQAPEERPSHDANTVGINRTCDGDGIETAEFRICSRGMSE